MKLRKATYQSPFGEEIKDALSSGNAIDHNTVENISQTIYAGEKKMPFYFPNFYDYFYFYLFTSLFLFSFYYADYTKKVTGYIK